MMSPVSERVVDASPPEWEGRVVRSLTLEALALLQAGPRDRPSTLPKMLDTEDTNGLRTLARYSTTHTNTRYRY